MVDLTDYQGRRIELEIDGRKCSGRVVRGPARQLVFLEERGSVAARNDMHQRLSMSKIWTARDLEGAKLLKVLGAKERAPAKKKKEQSWADVVTMAEADPAMPPKTWQEGMLAWAEKVYLARRKVERSRKAMMNALREAAG